VEKWKVLKRELGHCGKIVATGYGAFAAIRQAQHPTVGIAGWLLWTGATVTSLLFAVRMFERAPSISGMVCRFINRRRNDS
jgi:hypothetical protein